MQISVKEYKWKKTRWVQGEKTWDTGPTLDIRSSLASGNSVQENSHKVWLDKDIIQRSQWNGAKKKEY